MDFSGGNPIPTGGLMFHGGDPTSGPPGDALVLDKGTWSGSFHTITHTFTNESDGSVSLEPDGPDGDPASTITYTGLEPVNDSLDAVHRIFTFTGGAETITLTDAAGASMDIDSNAFGEVVHNFPNPTASLTINAGTGDDIVNITSVDAAFAASLTINGDAGNDTVNLNAPITFAAGQDLNVDLTDDSPGGGEDTITIGTNAKLKPSDAAGPDNGAATLKASKNIALAGGSSVETVNGDLTVEANWPSGATAGNFAGVDVNGGLLQSTGSGAVTVRGWGGNDPGGSQYGASVHGGGDIVGGVSTLLTVQGTGGASTADNNYGVFVDGSGSTITSGGGNVSVRGTGGGTGTSANNDGVHLEAGGQITGVSSATVTVTVSGTGGAGDPYAVYVGGPVSSASGKILIDGVEDAGGLGSDVRLEARVSTSAGGEIEIRSDDDLTGDDSGSISSKGPSDGAIKITADEEPDGDGTIQLDGSIDAGTADVTFSLADCDGYVEATAGGSTGIVTAANIVMGINGRPEGVLRLQAGTGAANNNTFSGTTTVVEGTLLVNGKLTDTAPGTPAGGDVQVQAGGVLGGDGDGTATGLIVGSVTVQAGGTLDPGDVSGCAPVPGGLSVNGNVVIDQNGYFRVQLNGLTARTLYDQLRVNGTVDLSGTVNGVDGSILTGTAAALPFGAELRIIDNDQADSIDTRFDGLEEGDFLTTFGQLMNISYRAGDNKNDVVLTTPGRFDFDGYNGDTAQNYLGVSPFDAYTGLVGDNFGWDVTAPAPASLPPQYFERTYTPVPPCTAVAEPELRLDGQSTDSSGTPLRFLLDVEAGKTYEVLILTGDVFWNHDKEQFTAYDTATPGTFSQQVVDTWGAGAPDGSGVKVTSGGGTVTTCPTYYRWVRLPVVVGGTLGNTRTIAVEMKDNGGYDGAAVILGMDVRPVATVGQIVLTRTSPTDAAAIPPDTSFSSLPADGVTIDSYQGTGAPPGSTITITVSAAAPDASVCYATVTTDADPSMFGTQVTANSSGSFTFSVQRPATLANTTATAEDWTVLTEERSGLSRGAAVQTYGKPAAEALRFDFGVYGSPVQTYGTPTKKFLEVIPQTTYNATRGYGWTSRVAGAWRKSSGMSDLRTDLNYAKNATFKVDLPNGNYSVRIYHSNPMYYGTVPYIADNFNVYAEGALQYNVADIPAGTSDIRTFSVTVVGGALELQFTDMGGRDGNFVVSGIDISAVGQLPAEQALLASGDPLDGGAPAISVDMLQPVVAEAAARWSAAGLTPAQAATLGSVQFAVADLGGAVLGLANPATNAIRIDDDAAMIGWSLGKYKVGSVKFEGIAGSPFSLLPSNFGVDLLTVVMHEMGHLLGYGHSEDGLMAPVLSACPQWTSSPCFIPHPSSFTLHPSPFIPHPSSLTLHPPSLIPHPSSLISYPSPFLAHRSSRLDAVFAELGDDDTTPLIASKNGDLLLAAAVRPSDEAAQAKVPRRSRLLQFQSELDAWFAELATEGGAVAQS